jgi:hypothetical protein
MSDRRRSSEHLLLLSLIFSALAVPAIAQPKVQNYVCEISVYYASFTGNEKDYERLDCKTGAYSWVGLAGDTQDCAA